MLDQETLPEVSSQPASDKTRMHKLTRSPLMLLLPAFLLAMGMWAVDFQPVSSDATKLVVAYEPSVSDADLLDPKSAVWKEDRSNSVSKETDAAGKPTGKIATTIVPMSAQYIIPQEGGSILEVRARAAFNDRTMAVLVQWQDDTMNFASPTGKAEYSDSVAVEFPLKYVPGHQPFRCMGQPDAEVNIWQWKAERAPEIAGNSRVFGTDGGKAAKNYVGPGVGYLKDGANADPDSKAFYNAETKTWSVVFSRPLTTADEKSATQFKPGVATNIAFAVWNGGNGERLSKKSVSTWVDFIFQPGEGTTQTIINLMVVGGTFLMLVLGVVVAWRLLPGGVPKK